MDLREPEGPRAPRAHSRDQQLQTGPTVLDETAERHNRSRRRACSWSRFCVPLRIHCVLHIEDVSLDSLVRGDGEPCNLVLPCCQRFDRTLPANGWMSLPKESVGGEIVDRDRDHEPAAAVITRHPWDPARIVLFTPQDVVCQARFLHVSGCAEQFAGRGERLGDFGDESGRAQNCELRAQRREQVAAVTLPSMIGMDGDLVNEGTGRPLGANLDGYRSGARESDHAAAAPDLEVPDRSLERRRSHLRLVGHVRGPAAIQRVNEQTDVVRAAEAICGHRYSTGGLPRLRSSFGEARRSASARRRPDPPTPSLAGAPFPAPLRRGALVARQLP